MTKQKPEKPNLLKCEICGNYYFHLGSHIYKAHKIKAKEYKTMFGLDHKTALICKSIYDKKKKHFDEHREKYLTNFLKAGEKYRFNHSIKGKTKVGGYISAQAKRRQMEQIVKINKNRTQELCVICNIKFEHLDSHLYNKHRLLRVKNDD